MFQSKSSSGTAEPKQIAAFGAKELTYETDHASYRVSAGAFFQVNRHLINKLVDLACNGYASERALDLYAGVGLFSTSLARRFAQVIAVESSQTSHAELRPDLVVLDPPRSGLGETVVQSLAGLGAHRMTYISCDPATASRDLAGLLSAGYRIEQVHLVDLFPQTYHLESVFHLAR
jgi:23S rRNA (uracil1939-C5)-methyltransferase